MSSVSLILILLLVSESVGALILTFFFGGRPLGLEGRKILVKIMSTVLAPITDALE